MDLSWHSTLVRTMMGQCQDRWFIIVGAYASYTSWCIRRTTHSENTTINRRVELLNEGLLMDLWERWFCWSSSVKNRCWLVDIGVSIHGSDTKQFEFEYHNFRQHHAAPIWVILNCRKRFITRTWKFQMNPRSSALVPVAYSMVSSPLMSHHWSTNKLRGSNHCFSRLSKIWSFRSLASTKFWPLPCDSFFFNLLVLCIQGWLLEKIYRNTTWLINSTWFDYSVGNMCIESWVSGPTWIIGIGFKMAFFYHDLLGFPAFLL